MRSFSLSFDHFAPVLAVALGLTLAAPTSAAIFMVDARDDAGDIAPGDGICATASGRCTLRAALDEANALAGADEIQIPAGFYEIRGPLLTISDDLTIVGAGAKSTIVNARNRSSVFRVDGAVNVSIRDITVQGGRGERGAGIDNPDGDLTLLRTTLKFNRSRNGQGGALYNNGEALLEEVTVIGNISRTGGAIHNDADGQLTLRRSSLRRNRHRVAGPHDTLGGGGCLYNLGDATVEQTLFARCQGRIGDGGGGIHNKGTVTMTNSTMWGCRARLSRGGAIVNDTGATLEVASSTIVRNQAAFVGAGIVNEGTASMRNSILWGNFSRSRDANCGGSVPIQSLGYNLEGREACNFQAAGDMNNTDPKVGRDTFLGGTTRIRGLRPGSPAIDSGDPADCPPIDQRGVPRPQDGSGDGIDRCDIGSFELDDGAAMQQLIARAMAPAPGVEAPEFRAHSIAAGHQLSPAIATLPEGQFLVVWQGGPDHDSDGEGIFAQRFGALGHPQGDPFIVNQQTAGHQTSPAVATIDDGSFVVAWESLAGDGSPQGIVLRHFAADGTPASSDLRVDSSSTGPQNAPSVSLDATGAATVAWLDDGAEGERILLRRHVPSAGLGPVVVAEPSADDTVDRSAPALAVASDGTQIVVWAAVREDSTGIFARILDANAAPTSDVIAVWTAAGDLPDTPAASVAAGADGRFIVVWQVPGEDQDGGDRDTIFGQRLQADGSPLGPRFRVSTEALGYRAHPKVAASPGGHFLVVWENETEDDVKGTGVTARRFDDNAKPLGPEFHVSTRAFSFQVEPAVAAHANGSFQVVWASEGADGEGFGVFGHTTALEGYVGIKVKEPAIEGNRLPRHWNVRLDDLVITDGDDDDPENHRIGRAGTLLRPSIAALDDGDLRPTYLRLALTPAKHGAGPQVGTKLPRPVRHRARRWEVDNRLGTIVLQSIRPSAVWIPAGVDKESAQADATPYICYRVKPMKDELGSQMDNGKFRRDLQLFAADAFDDCAVDRSGARSFKGTIAEGKCLYHIRKPVELCSPASLDAVEAPRLTSAAIEPLAGAAEASLLCYDARPATRVHSADAAVLLGQRGQLSPPQSQHRRRMHRFGADIPVDLAASFPAPFSLDTSKTEMVCLPTRVRDVVVIQ